MTELEHDPLLQMILALRADVDDLKKHEEPKYAISTWTPAWVGTGTAGVFTYTTQAGFYVVIGKLVFFWAQIVISAIGTPPVGSMTITGLPLTSGTTAGSLGQVFFGTVSNFNYSASALELAGIMAGGSAVILMRESFDNSSFVAVPAANFTNASCSIALMGFYPLP